MKSMKTTGSHTKTILRIGAACALAMAAWLPASTAPAQQVKGAQLLMTHVTSPAQIENLKPGDAVAMVCAKCKSVMVHNVTTEKGHIQVMTVSSKHLCPGCGATITTVGFGKGKKDEVKHVCEKCGSDSVFCCATQPDGGPTKGMEKK
jgi:hypothetical protein